MRRVFEREKDVTDEIMRRKIHEAIEDPGSDIDADVVFERLERRLAERMRADKSGG